VEAKLATRCEVQLAYAIGVADPVSVLVETFGTGVVSDRRLEQAVRAVFDLTPAGIVEALELTQPIYRATAAYGHFGRKPVSVRRGGRMLTMFSWERTDRVQDLLTAVG
jgi:S-adenosylmethionine synthetase